MNKIILAVFIVILLPYDSTGTPEACRQPRLRRPTNPRSRSILSSLHVEEPRKTVGMRVPQQRQYLHVYII